MRRCVILSRSAVCGQLEAGGPQSSPSLCSPDPLAGPFWYASGATIQILLFGILAVEIKRKAPNAHTMLEIIRARWGNTAHKVRG